MNAQVSLTTEAPSRLAGRTAVKMNGIGNEIVILDLRGDPSLDLSAGDVRALHAAPRLVFDQLMVLHPPKTEGTACFVKIYNGDGSEAGACGNGTRCVAWYLLRDGGDGPVAVETAAGVLACERLGAWRFAVDMGPPRLGWNEIPLRDGSLDPASLDLGPGLPTAFALSMGNPHAVLFVDDLEDHDLAALGPALEHASVFPERANISLAQVMDRHTIALKVWERGAGATLACGSAACATAVAAAATGRAARDVAIDLPGGRLDMVWRDDGHVIMAGPVAFEFETGLI